MTRFIIITVLPGATARLFDGARRLVGRIGSSRAALAYPPHVTLRTGVLVPDDMVDFFIDEFGDLLGHWAPFTVATEGIFCSTYLDGQVRKNIVGYRVRKDAALAALNQRLLAYVSWRASDRLAFEPHLTLAFDDLGAEGAQAVSRWREANPRVLPDRFQWTCDNVTLCRKIGDKWELFASWRAGVASTAPSTGAN